MCEHCGCGSGEVVITDPATGKHVHMDVSTGHEHSHLRDHGHSHTHSHTHDHRHDHEHVHSHSHGNHGHSDGPQSTIVKLESEILAKNNLLAERNRGWFTGRGILSINLMSSPGSGKTTLLERTIREAGPELSIHVIEGDQATLNDAQRIQSAGCPVVQVNTGAGCHLDAAMLARSLTQLSPPPNATVIIENVGNLVCPALFDLGERVRVVVAAVTEGEDKPQKYPHMFRSADVLLLNKVDLLPYVKFDIQTFERNARQANSKVRIFHISATAGTGMPEWLSWLRETRKNVAL